MYNRYIPTENGGYRRQIVEERQKPTAPQQTPLPQPIQTRFAAFLPAFGREKRHF